MGIRQTDSLRPEKMPGTRRHLLDIVQVDQHGDVPLETVVACQGLWKCILRESDIQTPFGLVHLADMWCQSTECCCSY